MSAADVGMNFVDTAGGTSSNRTITRVVLQCSHLKGMAVSKRKTIIVVTSKLSSQSILFAQNGDSEATTDVFKIFDDFPRDYARNQ